jgi:hypothetical protein
MTPEDQLRLIRFLEGRVQPAGSEGRQMDFELPGREELLKAGIPEEGVTRLLAAPWLEEMAQEVRDTPEFCGQEVEPSRVLRYARDVVGEYLRKRLALESDS